MSTMSLTKILLPAALALALWGGVMAVTDLRQGNKLKIFSAAGTFTLLLVGMAVMMEFITRPL